MPHTAVSFAPGRVELLGNHTDYNQGFVLSAAIHLGIRIDGERLPIDEIDVSSQTNGRSVRIPLQTSRPLETDLWANYPLGVIIFLRQAGYPVGGMRLRISNTLPVGAGLSSSAALEVATALVVARLFEFEIEPMKLAQLCQRAENDFVGVRSGLLDQASSVFGKSNQLILLDFRLTTAKTIPIPDEVALLLMNSGVPHELAGSKYNERYSQCMAAAAAMHAKSLRDVTSEQLKSASIDPLLRRRGLHITGENERVLAGVEALRAGNSGEFGELMFLSHNSSRFDFENSTPFLDALVDIARETPGVLGSRLSGGGFGGSTVSLVSKEQASSATERIAAEYRRRTGVTCTPILTEPSNGARIIE
ncbi:MAG: galactokinase [Chthoniobacterales bacterium]